MANSYYTNTRTLTPGTTARGDEVDDKFDGVTTGFDGVEADIQNAIKLTNVDVTTNQEIADNAASRADRVIGFDASGNLVLKPPGAKWRGDWATSQNYAVNDIIKDAAGAVAQDNIYICITAHTSANLATDISNWALMVDVTQVSGSTTEAKQWASHPEDDDVDGYPGQFSALHHAAKAAASAAAASGSANAASTSASNAATSESNAAISESNAAASEAGAAAATTFENLQTNGDVGTGATQVAQGNHNHDSAYSAIGHNHAGVYEPVLTAASQAEMEAGTQAALRSMSPLRVKQAIDALAGAGGKIKAIVYGATSTSSGTTSVSYQNGALGVSHACESGSNRVLVLAAGTGWMTLAGDTGFFRIHRGTTGVGPETQVDGSSKSGVMAIADMLPGDTASHTYRLKFKTQSGSQTVNLDELAIVVIEYAP